MIAITDITGASIEATDLDAAIKQCRMCKDSHYKMPCGHTVGENHTFMLTQLEAIKQRQRRERWLASTQKRYDEGKRFTKSDIGYEIGRYETYRPASLYWHHYTREQMIEHFNRMFGTDIK
jgi:hypothetical protein